MGDAMSIAGKWIISEVNAFDKNFKQTWRAAGDVIADSGASPMQRAMAQSVFVFEEDGGFKQLVPKELDAGGEYPAYDDSCVIAKVSKWKEENGKLFVAAEEDGQDDWQEIQSLPDGSGFIIFGFFKIVKA
jgi:hypothetical protein